MHIRQIDKHNARIEKIRKKSCLFPGYFVKLSLHSKRARLFCFYCVDLFSHLITSILYIHKINRYELVKLISYAGKAVYFRAFLNKKVEERFESNIIMTKNRNCTIHVD